MATVRKVGSISKCLQSVYWKSSRPSTTFPRATYGGVHTITLLPGDGVGPELMAHVRQVFRYVGAPVKFEEIKLDKTVLDESELENALLAIKRNGIAIKGNLESKIGGPSTKSRNVEMRDELDLFANVVRCRTLPGVPNRLGEIDIAVIRENTEGEYASLEHESVDGVIESLKIITEHKSKRIAKYAFDYAVKNGRKKVTCVHKANIMKLADGLFMRCCQQVAKQYPDIEFNTMIVDNCSMQLVSNPQQFDVMVLPNLYGNIIANIAAGLVGGSGIVAGSNIGEKYAIFEMGTRPTGRTIEGMNVANPTSMLLTSADMLDHIGLESYGTTIREAVMEVISEDKITTQDIGGQATTTEVVQAIIERIKQKTNAWY